MKKIYYLSLTLLGIFLPVLMTVQMICLVVKWFD